MRRSVSIGAVFVAVAFGHAPPASADMTGNDLWRACSDRLPSSPTYMINQMRCLSYIDGVVDGVMGLEKLVHMADLQEGRRVNSIFCLSGTVTSGQIMDVVVKALAENPESRDIPANTLVITSVLKGFDCDNREPHVFHMPSRQPQWWESAPVVDE